MSNTLKTTALLGLLTGLLLLFGKALGGDAGMVVALIIAFLMNFGAYWFSDKIVLAMYGAQAVSASEAPELSQIVRTLSQRAGLPMPRLYIVPSETPNAFATGRNPEHAAVAATQGLLKILDREEAEGVLAHELAHVKNRDTLTMAVAATLAGAIMMLANMARWAAFLGTSSREDEEGSGGGILGMIVMAVLAPFAAMLIQMAISRSREFAADAAGAAITRKPGALAAALEKLEKAAQVLPLPANPATSHLFIVNPLRGGSLWTLFATHPPIEERVRRLRAMRVY